MKRRLLFISLALALVLATLMPAAALAAKPTPFNASGIITYISPGTVLPAGDSDRWVVVERELGGTLSGDINDDFTMTYKANVKLSTQAGNLQGTLTAGSYTFNLEGKIEPLVFAGWFAPGIPLYQLTINGNWTFTNGAKGTGDFDAWVIFIPTPEGHVGWIVESAFNLIGEWQP